MLRQAVILCGGLGTRLGELTANTPKPLLPVNGVPFLDILIQEIVRYGFQEILLLAGRHGDQILTYQDRTMFGARVRVLVEPEPLGTGGALRFALDALDPEFLLANGDSWIDADLTKFSRSWERNRANHPGALAQLLLHGVKNAERFGIVETRDGKVEAFREKGSRLAEGAQLINAGVYIFRRELIVEVPSAKAVSLERDILPAAVARGQVLCASAGENRYFVDIGVPDSYRSAQTELQAARRRPAIFFDRDGTLNRDVGHTHRVDDLHWMPDAQEAVAYANARGFYVFVVTNQAGVAKGFYPEAAILLFHDAMQASLFEIGAHIDAFEWCPHHPDGVVAEYRKTCERRKPGKRMLAGLMEVWPVDSTLSLMIGDAESDMNAAAAAGIKGVRYRGGSLLALLKRELGEPGGT